MCRAVDFSRDIDDADIASEGGVDKICKALQKKDALSVVSSLYKAFNKLLDRKSSTNESFKNFESRFSAQVSRYRSHGSSIDNPESIKALLLLLNAHVSDSKRIPILSFDSSKAEALSTDDGDDITNDDMIKLVIYESVASVIRQCDKSTDAYGRRSEDNNLSSNSAHKKRNGTHVNTSGNSGNFQKNRLSPHKLRQRKLYSKCNLCDKFGNWTSDHNNNGSVKFVLPSNNHPPRREARNGAGPRQNGNQFGNQIGNQNRNNQEINNGGHVLIFNMANIDSEEYDSMLNPNDNRNIHVKVIPSISDNQLGTLVDSAAT